MKSLLIWSVFSDIHHYVEGRYICQFDISPPGSQESEHLIQNGAAPILNLSDVFLDVHYWYYFGYIIFDLEQEVASFAQEVWSPDNQIPEKSLQKFWGLQSSSVLNSVPWSCL